MALVLTCLPAGYGTNTAKKDFASCLPADVKLEEVVSAPPAKSANGKPAKQITVRDKLLSLKAHCKKGKLVAGNGREIRFYRLIGCWGNPPDDYEEQLKHQSEELARLKKKYTVVEIPCALDPRQIM
jgi:hypothetical protein